MPVLVACSCGKQLRVPDEAVGRNIRCPVCKAVILATPSAPPTIPTTASATTDTNAAMIRFSCGACGKEMQALAEYGGQETACPDCNGVVIIPGRAGVVTAPPPAPTPYYPATEPDRPAPPEEEPPSSRRLRPARRRRVWLWVVAALLLASAGGFAAWFFFLRTAPSSDLALIPANAQGFISVRAAELWKSDALLRVRNTFPEVRDQFDAQGSELGLKINDCERITFVFKDAEDAFRVNGKASSGDWWLIFLASHPLDKKKILEKLVPDSREGTYQTRMIHTSRRDDVKSTVYFHSDRIFVFGPKEGVQSCLDHLTSPKNDGPLKAAIDVASQHQFVAALATSPRTLEKLRTDLPVDAGKRLAALLDMQNLTLTGDLNPSLELELTLAFASADKAGAAKAAADALKDLALEKFEQVKKATNFQKNPETKEIFDQIENTLNAIKLEQKKDSVLVQLKSDAPDRVLLKAVELTRDAVAQAEIDNNLRRLAAAMRDYAQDPKNAKHDFPPAARYGPGDKPLLSWRVLLLPYLGEEKLYKEFNPTQDWSSPQNKLASAKMPAVYRMPDQIAGSNATYFKVFTGPDAPFDKKRQLLAKDFNGGLSKTVAVVVASTPVEWTKPDDVPLDARTFMPGVLGRATATSFKCVMFDGTIHTYPRTLEPKDLSDLKLLIAYKGKKPANP